MIKKVDELIRLMTTEEYRKYKPNIPVAGCWWWLSTPTPLILQGSSCAMCVFDGENGAGMVARLIRSDEVAVRPMLHYSQIKERLIDLENDEELWALGVTWKRLDEEWAIAMMPIGFVYFDKTNSDYERSHVRKWLGKWISGRVDMIVRRDKGSGGAIDELVL